MPFEFQVSLASFCCSKSVPDLVDVLSNPEVFPDSVSSSDSINSPFASNAKLENDFRCFLRNSLFWRVLPEDPFSEVDLSVKSRCDMLPPFVTPPSDPLVILRDLVRITVGVRSFWDEPISTGKSRLSRG